MKNVKNLMALHPERKVGEKTMFHFTEKLEKVSSKPSLTTCTMLHWFFYPKSNMVNLKKTLRKTEQSSDYNRKAAG